MSDVLKRMIALSLTFIFALSLSVFAGNEYTVEDAYEECKELHPDFVANIKANGATDDQIIIFIDDIKSALASYGSAVTRESFSHCLSDAIDAAISLRHNLKVRDAIMSAYPGSITNVKNGTVPDEFRPIYETVRRIVFDHDMIGIAPKITSVSASVSKGTVTVRISSSNISSEKIVIAIYDKDNTLLAALAPDDNGKAVVNAPNACKVKAMCLNSLKSLYPSCEAKEVYL